MAAIKDVPYDKKDETILKKYLLDLSAPYSKVKKIEKWKTLAPLFTKLGLWMYTPERFCKIPTSLLSMRISSGKAVGYDPMTDKWLKQPYNLRMLSYEM